MAEVYKVTIRVNGQRTIPPPTRLQDTLGQITGETFLDLSRKKYRVSHMNLDIERPLLLEASKFRIQWNAEHDNSLPFPVNERPEGVLNDLRQRLEAAGYIIDDGFVSQESFPLRV